ncbi:MAG: DUF2157 domain-containing protein [Candidatus Berkelbacteria bacterium]
MEILFILVIGPWVMGIIYIVKLIANKKKNEQNDLKSTIFNIRNSSLREMNPERKKILILAADYLAGESPSVELGSIPAGVVTHAVAHEIPQPEHVEATTHREEFFAPERSHERFKSIDNINILLYIGAFLVVISAGIFVGFNYATLTGSFKTIFLAAFALVFYLAGLIIYLKSEKMKPAGLTFATIGLLVAPLVGLAYHRFVASGLDGNIIWCVTSAATLALYLYSLFTFKTAYISYFVTFVSLSLLESFVSLFNAPIYYFAWGMAIGSLIFLLISKIKGKSEELSKSFEISANIFLPISIIFSLITLDQTLLVISVNLLLAGIFYLVSSFLAEKENLQQGFFIAALALFPLATSLFMADKNMANSAIAVALAVFAMLYVILFELFKNGLTLVRTKALLIFGGLIAVIAALTYLDDWQKMSIFFFLYAIMINAHAFWRSKSNFNFAFLLVAALVLPANILGAMKNDTIWLLSLSYAILGVLLFVVRHFVSKWQEKSTILGYFGYIIALVISLVAVLSSGQPLAIALIFLLHAIVFFVLNYLEDQSALIGFAAFFFYIFAVQFGLYVKVAPENIIWYLVVAGLIQFLGSYLLSDAKRSKILSYAAIAGPLAGAIYGSVYRETIAPIFSLLISGVMLLIKGMQENNRVVKYIAGGLITWSVEWFISYMKVEELQIYMVISAAYFGLLAYLQAKADDKVGERVFTVLSLAFLTVPLLFQTFDSSNTLVYALALGIESIGLIAFGIGANNKLLRNWGISALVVNVLYQSRYVIATVPKWLIIGIAGILILVGATYLLSKREKTEDK